MEYSSSKLRSYLEKHFGYKEFRKGQEETIHSILSGRDTLAVMPTGGGKSLCYQLPAIILDATAIVISPLISLMKDQVDALEKNGISATFINSTLDWDELNRRLNDAAQGRYKLLYIAPERLDSKRFLEMLSGLKLSFLAIDEAHCISEWGHDFRPAYMNITRIFDYIPKITVGAYTATATPEVQDDIVRVLKMSEAGKFIKGFDRPNLSYVTEETKNKPERILEIVKSTKHGSTIVYCGSRTRVDETAEFLKKNKINALAYHAGMKDEYRKFVQEQFIGDKNKVIVATVAFGMGIDKPDVRTVIHANLTSTIESYYQEAGRAGRDGNESKCYMLYQNADKNLQMYLINSSIPTKEAICDIYNTIYDVNSVGIGSKSSDPIYLNALEIGNKANVKEGLTESILKLLETKEIIRRGGTNGLGSIEFTTSRERIVEYYRNNQDSRREVLEAIMRSISADAYNRPVDIDINHVIWKYHLNSDDFEKGLRSFELAGLMRYSPPGVSGGITIIAPRVEANRLPIDFNSFEIRRKRAYKKLEQVLNYAETNNCKRNYILNYFGDDEVSGTCGKCSGCLSIVDKSASVNAKVDNHKQTNSQDFLIHAILMTAKILNDKFGATTIIDVLWGSKSQKIKKFNLDKKPTYSLCSEYSKTAIQQEIDKAIKNGLLQKTGGLYPLIFLSEKGKRVLEDSQNMKTKQDSPIVLTADGKVLFERLLKLRNDIAHRRSIISNAIISDDNLRKMAEVMPDNLRKLQAIPEASKMFVQSFGQVFIEAIIEHISSVEINIKTDNQFESENLTDPILEIVKKVVNLANQEFTMQAIAYKCRISDADVARHLQFAIEMGIPIARGVLVSKETFDAVYNVIKENRGIILRDVNEKIHTKVDLPTLRVAIALARKALKSKSF